MACAAAVILISCAVALSISMVAAAPANSSEFISLAALKCSDITAPPPSSSSPSRMLGGVDPADEAPEVSCPVRFDKMKTYGRVTSRCRPGRRKMTPEGCCAAFKDFACPYADLMNDLSNGCADAMFFQIIVRGKLPPGIFSNICKEGPEGLKC